MSYEFKLPDLGEGIAEVELRKWLVKEGDRVAEHQAVLEVETDKALVEVPSPHAGIITQIHRREGETVRVGETLVTIEEAGEEAAATSRLGRYRRRSPRSGGRSPAAPSRENRGGRGARHPLVRKMARERGIDLQGIQGQRPARQYHPGGPGPQAGSACSRLAGTGVRSGGAAAVARAAAHHRPQCPCLPANHRLCHQHGGGGHHRDWLRCAAGNSTKSKPTART